MSGRDVHPAARRGFGEAADSYTRARPDYPQEAVGWLCDCAALGSTSVAVELGAGTGKFTRLLLRTGARVFAVEPVKEMRAHLMADLPDVIALEGSAEEIPMANESADAVVCAQSFHWFATPAALTEIHRVLKPAGVLALLWNVPDERVAWVASMQRILAEYDADCPQQFRHGNWRKAFPDRRFDELQLSEFVHTHNGSAQQVILERAQSLSYIANLPEPQRAAVARRLALLADSEPELSGGAIIAFPYHTLAYFCRKL